MSLDKNKLVNDNFEQIRRQEKCLTAHAFRVYSIQYNRNTDNYSTLEHRLLILT
jgi:hypothetical protein